MSFATCHNMFLLKAVIPQALLDHYISMTEPSKAQAIDTDLAKHCAFSFPAVVLTLGAKNWGCLRDTYELLAADMQVCAIGKSSLHASKHDSFEQRQFRACTVGLQGPVVLSPT